MRKKIIGSFLFSLFLVACTLVNLKATAVPEPTVIPPRTVIPSPPPTITPTAESVEGQPLPSPKPALPSPTPVIPPPQTILLVMVDALRSDHVSSYGYSRPTTPNLDALVAAQGARFARAVTTAPWTCPSVAAMLTGRTPSSLGVSWLTLKNSIPEQANTLAEYLQQAGYLTAGFVSTYCNKSRLGFSQGFDYYYDTLTDRPTSDKARAVDINAHAIEWLQNSWLPQAGNGQPLFLFLYYFDPHVWYDPLPPYDTLYDSDYSGWLTPAVYRDSQDAVAGKITLSERDLRHLIALYDGEITYWDTYFGQMITFLEEKHLLDNALMLVTADHGESLGEHGKWTHGSSLYEEVLRVPLLMRYSGVIPAGVVVESPAQNFDLTPTILDWAGVALPQDLQALSLRSAALGETSAPQRQLFSEVDALLDKKNALYWAAPRISLRMVEQGDWKLLHYLEQPQLDELYLLQPSSLYEQENLILSEPHRAEQLLQDLNNWFDLAP